MQHLYKILRHRKFCTIQHMFPYMQYYMYHYRFYYKSLYKISSSLLSILRCNYLCHIPHHSLSYKCFYSLLCMKNYTRYYNCCMKCF